MELKSKDKGMLMKGIAPTAAMLIGATLAQAGQIGPDSFGYVAEDVPYSFTNIAATGTSILANLDNAASEQNIGFTFNFYGTSYTTAFISTNGLVTFLGGSTDSQNRFLTGPLLTDQPTIAPLWDDYTLGNDTTGHIYYETVGAPGSREFIVQWDDLRTRFNPLTDRMTFQMRLFEGSNNILFSYLDVDTVAPLGQVAGGRNGATAAVGIRDISGHTNGRNLQWSFDQEVIASESSILFEVPKQEIPEPGTIVLTGLGLGAAILGRRRLVGRN